MDNQTIIESTTDNTVETQVIKESQEPLITKREGTVLVILNTWLCFIPASDFDELFSIVPSEDKHESDVCELQEEKFRDWWGGWDTYLQSYCLRHARACMTGGKWNVNLVGVYYLRLAQ